MRLFQFTTSFAFAMKRFLTCGIGAGLLGLAGSASAALPEGVTSVITNLQTAATDTISAVLPVLSTVLVAAFGIAAVWFVYRTIRRALSGGR